MCQPVVTQLVTQHPGRPPDTVGAGSAIGRDSINYTCSPSQRRRRPSTSPLASTVEGLDRRVLSAQGCSGISGASSALHLPWPNWMCRPRPLLLLLAQARCATTRSSPTATPWTAPSHRRSSGRGALAKPWTAPVRCACSATTRAGARPICGQRSKALRGSAWLVLMASPNAARSPWVDQEVAWWLANTLERTAHCPHRGRVRLAVDDPHLIHGLPPSLRSAFTAEPRWVDLRWAA